MLREAAIPEYGGKVGIVDCGRKPHEEVFEWPSTKNIREPVLIAVTYLHQSITEDLPVS